LTIPVLKPSIGEEEIAAVQEVLRSGWLGLGPKTAEFEEKFAEYVGADYAVGLNSGTAALHLAVEALGVQKGDEVIVTPMTFISSVHAIAYTGATPVFADIEHDTMNIDVKDIEQKISDKTKAIIVVHLAGHPCEIDEISELADRYGLYIIEDAAHACGATYKGHKVGSLSDLTCFSFHAVKNLTCGEGGAITCNSEWYTRFFKEMRWVGISKDTWTRSSKEKVYAWQYWVDKIGYKYHMSDINAAIGIVQLQKIDRLNEKRRYIAKRYVEGLKDLDWITLPQEKPHISSSWHLFQIKLPSRKIRDNLIAHLKDNDVSPGVHYLPAHLQPCYRNIKASVPVANEIWKRILSLPMFPDLTDGETDKVIDAVRSLEV